MKRATLASYIAVALIWGSSWIADQSLAGQASPLAAGALRFALGALLLAPFCRRAQLDGTRNAAVLGLSMLALPYALLVWAGAHGSGGWTPLVYAALPLLAAIDGGWRPAMIAAIGATLVVLNGSLPLSLEKALWALPILLADASQAFALHFARRHPPRVTGLALQFVLAAFVLAFLSRSFESPPRLASITRWSAADGLWLLALVAPATALAYWLYYGLLRELSPAQAASTQWLQFAVTVIESALLFGQRPPLLMLVGLAALLVCVWRMLFATAGDEVTIRLTPLR